MRLEKILIAEKFAQLVDVWQQAVLAEFNDQEIKIAQFEGEFVWHRHNDTDEVFLVLEGEFDMQFRDRTVHLSRGECIVVPRGVEHCPKSDKLVRILLLEKKGTLNTGDESPSAFTKPAVNL